MDIEISGMEEAQKKKESREQERVKSVDRKEEQKEERGIKEIKLKE